MSLNIDLSKWKMNKSFRDEIKKYGDQNISGVVTRFPPAPNGFLHIGHTKALFINYIVAKIGNGKMLVRIDDTNPSPENTNNVKVILEDIADMLQTTVEDVVSQLSYTSNFFEKIIQCADQLVASGDAYVDGSSPEMINYQRSTITPSPYSNCTVEQNVLLWEQLKSGKLTGAVLRLKIDYKSPNGCMRDPTIYRPVAETHHRTGDTFKVYPTYDFACPIVDSLEGVTHVFRSTEFTDRNPQYRYILNLLNLRVPDLNHYGKLCFKDAVLSKRKIKRLIDDRTISGWDDPSLLTWRGAKRRGLSHEGLVQFLSKVGITKSVVEMEQNSLWGVNQKIIDKISTRLMAIDIDSHQKVEILDELSESFKEIPRFHRNPSLGNRKVLYANTIIMNSEDVKSLKEGEEVTLMNWGNAIYQGNNSFRLNLTGDFKKTEKKLCWVAENYVSVAIATNFFVENDKIQQRLVSFATENDIENMKKGDYVQFMRIGYYVISDIKMAYGKMSIRLTQLPKL